MKISIAKLSLDPKNARKHSQRNLDAIAASLLKFGQRKPLVVHRGVVLAGNGTLEAARSLGWTEIEVAEVPDDWDNDTAKAYALADNRTAELAEWDESELAKQLLELQDADWDITELGFEVPALADIEPVDENEIPEPPVEPKTKVGDIYQLGRHRLMCGDSTDRPSVERLMDGAKAELCFTSPPYSDQRKYNGGKELSTVHIAKFISASKNHCNYYAVNLGISRKNNAINQYWDDYINEAQEAGLKMLSWNVWNRQGMGGYSVGQITAMFAIEHEWIFIFGKKTKDLVRTVENKGAGVNQNAGNRQSDGSKTCKAVTIGSHRQLGTVYSGGVENRPEGDHPAAFPVDFPKTYIEAMTSQEDAIYEPFGGSGSTLIAAEQTNRNAYLMELDPKYCDVIVTRWENLTGQKAELVNSK